MATTNLDFITDRVSTGGCLADDEGEAIAQLLVWRDLGITHIVDNRLEPSDRVRIALHTPEITYLHIGVEDDGKAKPAVWFDAGTSFAREALAVDGAKLHVHCHMGINRGPSMAYAILLDQGWDPIDAIATIRRVRPIARTNYAEDALDWHHRRTNAGDHRREDDRRRLAEWRDANVVDFARLLGSSTVEV